ncbi:hypothetical protein BX659_108127 [Orenia metallireducens]|uniref:Phospholipid-binding protein, PBP family n=1 Tax=Orenia metallireducens TaxID=1413210 RepID=A0A285GQX4_9FIRM|nr:YbhB/YbcL family Raf kinase inhibitor-like protein [Orenia metallireducens]PRX29914.1 hypothetical protein BX659_108127 [Orenia metallireducens]SNY25634.1 hypothetical protein SAMN06265827_109127 [Orenia metallireducens]
MKLKVLREDNYLPDKYSKYAKEEYKYKENPSVSFPIKFIDKPEGTKTLALTLIDYDSIPVCGFAWIHWSACNIPGNIDYLPENISVGNSLNLVQGKNSFASPFVGEKDTNIIERYTGPTPPDKDHKYTLTVYALDCSLKLTDGYFLNEFRDKIKNHILDSAEIELLSRV